MLRNSLAANPFPIGPQHNFVARPRATSSRQGVCRSLVLKIFKLLCNFTDLQLYFTGDTLTIIQSLLDGVLLTHLAFNQLSIRLNGLERGDGLDSQLAIDFLEFVDLLTALLLAFLYPGSSQLQILQFCGPGNLHHQ